MKKTALLLVPCLMLMAGCKKSLIEPDTLSDNNKSAAGTQGYIKVNCDNCKVEFGMPDQYKTFNVTGKTLTGYFNYKSGYSLQTYITALDHDQNIAYTVYNKSDKVMFADTVKQSTTGYWSTNVMVLDN